MWLAPWRASDDFLARALFVSQRFDRIAIGDVPFRQAVWLACAAVGAIVLLRDLRVRLGVSRVHRHVTDCLDASHPDVAATRRTVARLASTLGIASPQVQVVRTERPLMHLHGLWHRSLQISTATLGSLPDAQRDAAIAHELAHLVNRDLRRSAVLLAVRLALFASPLVHLMARRQHQEIEWRADDVAAHVTGRPLALARALVASGKAASGDYLGLLGQGRLEALERRCQRLADGEYDAREPHRLPLWLTAAGLLATMSLVS
jgi:Zn-dependent protease with chaperone function